MENWDKYMKSENCLKGPNGLKRKNIFYDKTWHTDVGTNMYYVFHFPQPY